MFYDNDNIKMTKNHVFQYTKTKHIECHYHFIQEKAMSKKIAILHVPSIQQQANIFTKPLRRTKFEGLQQAIGVMSKSLVSLT